MYLLSLVDETGNIPNIIFFYRKSNANLVFYKMFDMNLNTHSALISVGDIFVYLYLCSVSVYYTARTAVVDYSALMHVDVMYLS